MKRLWLVVLTLLIFGAGGWYWGSPWWTLSAMQEAAQSRDVGTLSRYVDYDAVRESLKTQFRDQAKQGPAGGGSVFGSLVRGGVAERLVDLAVTPDAMRVIFASAPLAEDNARGPIRLKASDMKLRRDGLTRFSLERRDGKPGALIFRLRGAGWVLTDIVLPPNL